MRILFACLLVLSVLLFQSSVLAWSRHVLDDNQLVASAEKIVVARLKEGSIRLVKHTGMGSRHFNAVLEIVETLKGRHPGDTLSIVFHHGIDPAIGGKFFARTESEPGAANGAGGAEVILWDSGGVSHPFTKDIREEHIWILSRKSVEFHDGKPEIAPGISEPQHVWPATLVPYMRALLAVPREPAMQKLALEKSESGRSAKDFLGSNDLADIAKETDPARRFARIVPYFLDKFQRRSQYEAQLLLCEPRDGDLQRLVDLYASKEAKELRSEILSVMGRHKNPQAESFLISVLRQEEAFWSTMQVRPEDPFDPPTGSRESREVRLDSHRRCVGALNLLKEVAQTFEALAVAQMMQNRWGSFKATRTSETCSAAIQVISDRLKAASEKQ